MRSLSNLFHLPKRKKYIYTELYADGAEMLCALRFISTRDCKMKTNICLRAYHSIKENMTNIGSKCSGGPYTCNKQHLQKITLSIHSNGNIKQEQNIGSLKQYTQLPI